MHLNTVGQAGLEPTSLISTIPKACIRIQPTVTFVLAAEERLLGERFAVRICALTTLSYRPIY